MAQLVGTASYMYAKQGCYRCLRNDRIVDTDTHIDGEGALALCVGCVTDLALAAGLPVTNGELDALRGEVEALKTAKDNAEALLARVQSALRKPKAPR